MLNQTFISNSYFAFPSLPGQGKGKFRNWSLPCYSMFFSIKFWFTIPVNYSLLLFVFTYFLPLFWCHNFFHDFGMKISLPKSWFLFLLFHIKPLFLYLISSLLTGSFSFRELIQCSFLFFALFNSNLFPGHPPLLIFPAQVPICQLL